MAKAWPGFTLIEFLLIIAIISLLATISIVFLSQSRSKALDSSIKANLSQVRQEASLIYTQDNSYSALCESGSPPTLNNNNDVLARIEEEVYKRNGNTDVICHAEVEGKYCVQSYLASGYFCVDSTGRAVTATDSECDANSECI